MVDTKTTRKLPWLGLILGHGSPIQVVFVRSFIPEEKRKRTI